MKDQFISILQNGSPKEMVSFLKSLTEEQKKELAPVIKTTYNDYLKYKQVTKGNITSFSQKASATQKDILLISSFACLTRTDFEKLEFPAWVLEERVLRHVINWYCPPWFSDFVNKEADKEFLPWYINYRWVMELSQLGLVHPSKELIVKLLPQLIFENKDNTYSYKPEKLLEYDATLAEHIWFLFELESNLHYSDRFLYFGKDVSKETLGWKLTFSTYAAEGKIDRQRLLKETLLASNKNFNKVLSGWFVQLFMDLQPTAKELLTLQKELCSVLNSPHSKVVNASLQMIKTILDEKSFDIPGFLDAAPVLLTSDTKATVSSALMILEKIAKKHKEHREKIGVFACQVFVHPQEDLQAKAAKLIAVNRDSLKESFHQELAPFHASMLTSAKKILGNFTDAGNAEQKASVAEPQTEPTQELTKIPAIENIDDLVFLASQVFDNNETWHLEQLAASLVKFRSQLKPEHIPRFEPAFQRALNITKNGLRSNMGFLEHLLAMFLIDFGNYLMRNFPEAAESVRRLYTKYDQVEGENRGSWTVSPENSSYTESWEPYSKVNAYKPHKHLLTLALGKIVTGDDLPILSAPTHAPGWIMQEILIDRLHIYQQNGKHANDMDMQIAIAKCYLKNADAAYIYAQEKLSGEFLNIMHFLLHENAEPKGPFVHKNAWMVASLSKKEKKPWPAFDSFHTKPFKRYAGQLEWQSIDEEYTYERYDHEAKKYVQKKGHQKILRVFKDGSEKKQGALKKVLSGLLPAAKADPPFLYDWLLLKTQFSSSEHNDIKRLMLLAPNNPEPFLADIINQCLKYPTFFSESDKKLVIATLQLLHEIWDDYGEMADLFIGTCMIASDKTAQNIAGEIWINAVANNKINNQKLGEVIGKHESIEFSPMKRFTDLTTKQLFRISDKHNVALQIVVENILKQLPDKPITNLKKLLEIYGELLAINKTSVTEPIILKKMQMWKGSPGTQKIANILLGKG